MQDQQSRSAVELQVAKAHELVGRAISRWVLIEDALASTLAACMGPAYQVEHGGQPMGLMTGSGAVSGAIMHAQNGFSGKLTIVTEALFGAFFIIGMPDKVEKDWNSLKSDLEASSRKRNKLAHWSIMIIDDEPALSPSWSNGFLNRRKSAKYAPISMSAIQEYCDDFLRLWQRINEFNVNLALNDELQSFMLKTEISGFHAMSVNCPQRLRQLMGILNQSDSETIRQSFEALADHLSVGDGDASSINWSGA